MEELLPRLNGMRVRCRGPRLFSFAPEARYSPLGSRPAAQQKRYAELRRMYRRMIAYTCLLLFVVISGLHLALLYRPELLRARLTERLIREMWTVSPVFKYLQVRESCDACCDMARVLDDER